MPKLSVLTASACAEVTKLPNAGRSATPADQIGLQKPPIRFLSFLVLFSDPCLPHYRLSCAGETRV